MTSAPSNHEVARREMSVGDGSHDPWCAEGRLKYRQIICVRCGRHGCLDLVCHGGLDL